MSSNLTVTPVFEIISGKNYLVDRHNHPVVFTTRFSAISKVQLLKKEGHNVEMEPNGAFYRIIKID